jgi:signal transduction histidine kinase
MRSLRWRLALAFAVLAGGVAGVIGVVVYEVTAQDLHDRARAKAVQSVQQAASLTHVYGRLPAGALSVTSRGASTIPAELRTAVGKGYLATFTTTSAGQPVIWAGVPSPNAPKGVYVMEPSAADADTLTALERTLLVVGLAATAGGAMAGLALASRLSLRLRRAAGAAERVAAGDLAARVNASGRDEVAALGRAMDRMAESLQTRLVHEQRFVADVAHDLRTPLTGLIAAASLLESDQVGTVVKERAARLRQLVEDLLEISRLENGAVTADLRHVGLVEFVRSVIERHVGVELEVEGAPGTVLTDPRRLERVLDNLILNAARHGAPPVVARIAPGKIAICDHGPGFSADMLARATERFATGDPARGGGIGLGLAIAAAQTRVLGGKLTVSNGAAGAIATVDLPTRAPTQEREAGAW